MSWHRFSVRIHLAAIHFAERWEKNEGDAQEFFNHFVGEVPHLVGPLMGGH